MTQPYPPRQDPRGYQPYGQQPTAYQPYAQRPRGWQPPAPEPPAKKSRKWLWIGGGIAALLVLGTIANGGDTASTTAADPAAPTVAAPTPEVAAAPLTVAAPEPKTVTLPEVKGRNGGIVYDELIALGLTKLQMATRDEADKVVLLPSNWTAVKIEPAAGTQVRTDQTVVVTMTKN